MENKRILWVDSIRGFGILAVTLGHLGCLFALEKHIYSFHMFLFFFISGFLFSNKSTLKNFIIKKTKTLFLPFLAWNILAIPFAFLLGKTFKETVFDFFMIEGNLSWNAPIWFLLTLFFVETIYAVLDKLLLSKDDLKQKTLIFLVIIIFTIFLWYLFGKYNFYFKLNLVPLGLSFFAFGNFCRQLPLIILKPKPLYCELPITIVSAILSVVCGVVLNDRITYTGAYFGNIIYCVIAAFSGVIFYTLIFKNIKLLGNSKILIYLGRNSISIMAMQYFFFYFYNFISLKYFDIDIWHCENTIKAIILTIVTIVLIVLITTFLKKLFKNNKVCLNILSYFGV